MRQAIALHVFLAIVTQAAVALAAGVTGLDKGFSMYVASKVFNDVRNDILYIGYNAADVGERANPSEHSLRWSVESRFRDQYGGELTETSLDFTSADGRATRRPVAIAVGLNGKNLNRTLMSFAADGGVEFWNGDRSRKIAHIMPDGTIFARDFRKRRF